MEHVFRTKHDAMEYLDASDGKTYGAMLRHFIVDSEHGEIERAEFYLKEEDLVKLRSLIDERIKNISNFKKL